MTDEERAEPLPDLMYSRYVAIRIMRHAIWYLLFPSGMRVKDVRDAIAAEIIAKMQRDVLQMSTGDFFRIKMLGALQHKMNRCPCACHYDQDSQREWRKDEPCDTCKGLHVTN